MRVIRSTSGTIASITDSAGAKVWSFPQITRAAAEAKVFNPTGTYIDVSDAELTVLVEEANLRKTVSTVTNISGSPTDNTPVLTAIGQLASQIAALPAPTAVDLSSLTASIANLPAADAAAVIAALKAKL